MCTDRPHHTRTHSEWYAAHGDRCAQRHDCAIRAQRTLLQHGAGGLFGKTCFCKTKTLGACVMAAACVRTLTTYTIHRLCLMSLNYLWLIDTQHEVNMRFLKHYIIHSFSPTVLCWCIWLCYWLEPHSLSARTTQFHFLEQLWVVNSFTRLLIEWGTLNLYHLAIPSWTRQYSTLLLSTALSERSSIGHVLCTVLQNDMMGVPVAGELDEIRSDLTFCEMRFSALPYVAAESPNAETEKGTRIDLLNSLFWCRIYNLKCASVPSSGLFRSGQCRRTPFSVLFVVIKSVASRPNTVVVRRSKMVDLGL